ncbi:MAG: AbrB family transcriptional regulator [Erythrobacter sp.]|nr:AbrB family transcriptional regulator [Erythrobacter sp.]
MSHQSRMTVKGQITVPKDIREALGLAPGEVAEFVRNADGEIVLRHKKSAGDAAKRAAVRKSIDSITGLLRLGRPTEAIMRDLRGDEPLR